MKCISFVCSFFLLTFSTFAQQPQTAELVTKAISLYNGSGGQTDKVKAVALADQALQQGARKPEIFSMLRELTMKEFELSKEARKLARSVKGNVHDGEKYFDNWSELLDNNQLAEADQLNLLLYYLLFVSADAPRGSAYELFNKSYLFRFARRGDPAKLVGLMPFGKGLEGNLSDSSLMEYVCKIYLQSKGLYQPTAEELQLKEYYNELYSGFPIEAGIERSKLYKSLRLHEQWLKQFPASYWLARSNDNLHRALGDYVDKLREKTANENQYFWEDSYYQSHKPAKLKGVASMWTRYDTILSKTWASSSFMTQRNASYQDMFFSPSGDYLLVLKGPLFFNKIKGGKTLNDAEASQAIDPDFAQVFNVQTGYTVVRSGSGGNKLDSVLSLLNLSNRNFDTRMPVNVVIRTEKDQLYRSAIQKEFGMQHGLYFEGGLHHQGDTVIYSTEAQYNGDNPHINIFFFDTRTDNLIRFVHYRINPKANYNTFNVRFSPDLSRLAIQHRYTYANPSMEPPHDANETINWSAIEVVQLDDDYTGVTALDDTWNQTLQMNLGNWRREESEKKYQEIQENNRAATGTLADKLAEQDRLNRRLDEAAALRRQELEEQKWTVVTCPTCNGIGKTTGAVCFRCNGLGKVKIKK